MLVQLPQKPNYLKQILCAVLSLPFFPNTLNRHLEFSFRQKNDFFSPHRLPPASDLDPDYLQWQASKGIRDSFWCPTNNHNAHLNSFTPKEKFFLRNYERYPVSAAGTARRPPYAQEPSGSYHTFVEDREAARRSASMKKKEEAGKENLEVTDLELDVGLKTKHQIQEEGREAKRISVDVISGRPLSHKEARALIASEEAWRLARVVTHTTPGDYEGTRPHDKT